MKLFDLLRHQSRRMFRTVPPKGIPQRSSSVLVTRRGGAAWVAASRPIEENKVRLVFIAMVLFLAALAANAQVSVVPSTGIAPRFPKLDPELLKQTKPASRNWLRDADDDAERFRRIEVWAAAGDQEMHEIAARMQELSAAIQRESWDMSVYQLEKIRGRMVVAMTKRPVRTQNMEALFFDNGAYSGLHDALTSKDVQRARIGFTRVRSACMACHVAEKLSFINESAVFRELDAFPITSGK